MRYLTVLFLFSCMFSTPAVAQAGREPPPPPHQATSGQGNQGRPDEGVDARDPQFGREGQKDPSEEKMERSREKALNKQRQTQLEKDTERLLKLATELKQYVDKTDEHTLSLDVIKKAEEIEKLAKSVKEKMKGSY